MPAKQGLLQLTYITCVIALGCNPEGDCAPTEDAIEQCGTLASEVCEGAVAEVQAFSSEQAANEWAGDVGGSYDSLSIGGGKADECGTDLYCAYACADGEGETDNAGGDTGGETSTCPAPCIEGTAGGDAWCFCDAEVTWLEAVGFCSDAGTQLAGIERTAQNDNFVAAALSVGAAAWMDPTLTRFWLPANDRDWDGDWVDLDGVAITYDSWAPREPDGGTEQDCAVIYIETGADDNPAAGYWYDVECSTGPNKSVFACEI